MNFFGNKNALIGSIDLLVMGIYVLGALIFRKSVANDMLNAEFSVVGSSGLGCVAFILVKLLFKTLSIKYPIVIGLIAWIVGGFLLGSLIGDGWADGSGGGE